MSQEKEDGGAAFPKTGLDPWGVSKTVNTGMSLRDYFAAKAMQGRCGMEYSLWADLVEDAYAIADAMLKERDK